LLTSWRLWLGAIVSVTFLAVLLIGFDLSGMRSALADANYLYLIPGAGLFLVSLYFRAVRWRYLLKPFADTRANRLYPVVLVGYMTNGLLPMRLGELAQSYYLSTREPVRGPTALATLLIERVFDGIMPLFFLGTAALFLDIPGLAEEIGGAASMPLWAVRLAVLFPFIGFLGAMVLAVTHPQIFLAAASWMIRRLPERLAGSALELAVRFISGFSGLHHPRRLLILMALSAPIWLAAAGIYFIVALAFDLQDQLGHIGGLVLASSVPSSKGSVGPFEVAAALALVFVGVSSGSASAYAVIIHATTLLPPVVLGVVYLGVKRVSIGQLTRDMTVGGLPRAPQRSCFRPRERASVADR
jgi:uncharacterized protein (TIRG00374 family)